MLTRRVEPTNEILGVHKMMMRFSSILFYSSDISGELGINLNWKCSAQPQSGSSMMYEGKRE